MWNGRVDVLLRGIKTLTVASVAVWVSLIAVGNLTDYGSNFMFVSHVMSMDTTFPDSRLTYRAVTSPILHHVAYWLIILIELAIAVLCWWATGAMFRARTSPVAFRAAKGIATAGYGLALALWVGGFMAIGGEWFAMWQSATWNGQNAAFQVAAIVAMFMIFLHVPEEQLGQPDPPTQVGPKLPLPVQSAPESGPDDGGRSPS